VIAVDGKKMLAQVRVVGQLAARETLRPTGIDILSLVHS
jgi:hypothetical protein